MKTSFLISIIAVALGGCVFTMKSPTTGTIVSIDTRMQGASPETVETVVVTVIESALMALDGVESIQSTSSEGRGYVEVYFKTKEQSRHLQLVQLAVKAVKPKLPPLAGESLIVIRESAVLR